jgi:hypothetical protein
MRTAHIWGGGPHYPAAQYSPDEWHECCVRGRGPHPPSHPKHALDSTAGGRFRPQFQQQWRPAGARTHAPAAGGQQTVSWRAGSARAHCFGPGAAARAQAIGALGPARPGLLGRVLRGSIASGSTMERCELCGNFADPGFIREAIRPRFAAFGHGFLWMTDAAAEVGPGTQTGTHVAHEGQRSAHSEGRARWHGTRSHAAFHVTCRLHAF